jgi:hypothetical protein
LCDCYLFAELSSTEDGVLFSKWISCPQAMKVSIHVLGALQTDMLVVDTVSLSITHDPFEAGPSRAPEAVMEDVSALEMCSA